MGEIKKNTSSLLLNISDTLAHNLSLTGDKNIGNAQQVLEPVSAGPI